MTLEHTAKGVYAIGATPFTPEGAVDTKSVDRLTDFYLECGVTGLTILGIMGEAPKLDQAEALEGSESGENLDYRNYPPCPNDRFHAEHLVENLN